MLREIKLGLRSLNRNEMKKIKGGYAEEDCKECKCRTGECKYIATGQGEVKGKCGENSAGKCVCAANDGKSSIVTDDCKA